MTAAEQLTTAVAAPVPGRYQVGSREYEVTARPDGGVRILRVGSRSRWVVAVVRADGTLWLRSLQPQVREQVRALLADPDRALIAPVVCCEDCGAQLTAETSRARRRGPGCHQTHGRTT